MKAIINFLKGLGKLFIHEFGLKRYHEITGLVLKKKDEENEKYFEYEYRGLTLWIKEILESLTAFYLIFLFVYLLIIFINQYVHLNDLAFNKENLAQFLSDIYDFSRYILTIAGGFLILDSLLLIAALISSPGIDETIDSISVTIGGILLIFIGSNVERFIDEPELILKVVVPLCILVVILIFTKHALRKMHNCDAKGNQKTQSSSTKKIKIL